MAMSGLLESCIGEVFKGEIGTVDYVPSERHLTIVCRGKTYEDQRGNEYTVELGRTGSYVTRYAGDTGVRGRKPKYPLRRVS